MARVMPWNPARHISSMDCEIILSMRREGGRAVTWKKYEFSDCNWCQSFDMIYRTACIRSQLACRTLLYGLHLSRRRCSFYKIKNATLQKNENPKNPLFIPNLLPHHTNTPTTSKYLHLATQTQEALSHLHWMFVHLFHSLSHSFIALRIQKDAIQQDMLLLGFERFWSVFFGSAQVVFFFEGLLERFEDIWHFVFVNWHNGKWSFFLSREIPLKRI